VNRGRRASAARVLALLGLAASAPLTVSTSGDLLNNMVLALAYVVMALGLNIVSGSAACSTSGTRVLRDRRVHSRLSRLGLLGERRIRRSRSRDPGGRFRRSSTRASTSTSC
jgi:hypothetical protein